MHDPREGVTAEGMIRTGASADAINEVWTPVLEAAVAAVADDVPLYVYGSVATGRATVPTSDVDLLTVGLSLDEARRSSADLSARFGGLCREVTIGPTSWSTLKARGDEAYGLRVFLRHYCVHLAGPDPAAVLPAYPADARAARGFNGDIARHARRWAVQLEQGRDVTTLGRSIARKTLLAVTGLVSVRDSTWSTDRRACARRWSDLEPATPLDTLVAWLDVAPTDGDAVRRILQGPVAVVTESFESEIGLWRGLGPTTPPTAEPRTR